MMINENGDTVDVGSGNHFGGEDPDAAPLDDGEVIVNNIISTSGKFKVNCEILWWGKRIYLISRSQCKLDRFWEYTQNLP